MALYVVLGTFTDEGIRDIRNLRHRVAENRRRGEQLGLKVQGFYLTMGAYFEVVVEAPDDATMAAQALGVGSLGGSRTQTLRAFTLDEADAISQKLG
jgi:uncharacterized protein with GYD domain